MQAAVLDHFGSPSEALSTREMPRLQPAPGQVRVRMKFAPINPSDMMVVRGQYGRLPTLPATPGYEGMGVIDAVGGGLLAKIRGLKPGRRVAVLHRDGGTWAQEAVVSARHVVPLPDDLPDEQAASFFINPATVLIMVNRVLQVPRGSWLLQTAAGSALGRMVIRLGKHQGFRTINLIRSPEGAEPLRKLGADAVVVMSDSTQAAIEKIAGPEKVPYALDCVGGAMGFEAVRALGPGGRLLLYGTLSGEPIPLDPRALIGGSKRIDGFWLTDWVQKQGPLTMLGLFRQIFALLKAGVLTTTVEATYPLSEIRAAATHAEKAGRSGKILLKME